MKLEILPEEKDDFANRPAFRIMKKSGKAIWVRMGGSSATYQGKPASMGCLINVTPLRNKIDFLQDSLQRYETILSDVDVQLAEMDLNGNIGDYLLDTK